MELQYVEKVGIENEGWIASEANGAPVSLDENSLREIGDRVKDSGFVVREPGPGSVELGSHPATTVAEAVRMMLRVDEGLKQNNLRPQFIARSPWAGTTTGLNANTPRLRALVAATLCESRLSSAEHGAKFSALNEWAALHVHTSGRFVIQPSEVGDEAVFLANITNLLGPFLARALCEKHGVRRDPGHLAIYRGWAQQERFPHWGLWHRDGPAYIEAFESLPRLVRPVGEGIGKAGGAWEPDLVTKAKWGNPADDGSVWWPYCRLRPKYGTAELRFMPSCSLNHLEAVVSDLVLFVEIVLDSFQGPIESQRAFLAHSSWRDVHARMGSELGLALP